jgi:hypothetical protein
MEMFDRIASRRHRHPRFRDMPIAEINRLLADARRATERDLSDYETRLARDAIGFYETDGAAA